MRRTQPAPAPAPPPPNGAFDAYYQDVLQQVSGGPVRVWGMDKGVYPNTLTLLDTHTASGSVGATDSWTVDGQSFNCTIRTGRLVTISGANQGARDSALTAAIADVQPGDTILLRAGTYAGEYDPNGWNAYNFVLNAAESGTSSQRIHITSYPGETATITSTEGNFYFGRLDVAEICSYWDVSALDMIGNTDNVYAGQVTSDAAHPESGGTNIRLVGCNFHITGLGFNNVGMVEFGGDNWKVLANTFTNELARSIENQAHSVYIDNGADTCEVAGNLFLQRREGFVIMVHQDPTPGQTDGMVYTGIEVRNNYVQPHAAQSCRGFSMSNVDDTSTLLVEDNIFDGAGQSGFGLIVNYRGTLTARRNVSRSCPALCFMETDNPYSGTRLLIYGTGANANVVESGSLTMFSGAAGDRQAE